MVAAALCAAALLVLPAGGAAAVAPGCGAFKTQADAQVYFEENNGSPRHGVGHLDPDGDGVACEELGGPYVGYSTIGYNRSKGFIWGAIAMPETGADQFPCLFGNKNFKEAARIVTVFEERPGNDRQAYRAVFAEVRQQTGRLVWKAKVRLTAPGRYYAAVQEKVRLQPYGPNECPGFRSRAALLPKPKPTF